jgi:hypothetical protein
MGGRRLLQIASGYFGEVLYCHNGFGIDIVDDAAHARQLDPSNDHIDNLLRFFRESSFTVQEGDATSLSTPEFI